MNVALLFPGQGSQRVGMGRDLAVEFEIARLTFEEADDAVGFALSKLCWDGPEDRLELTENTQPAILVNSIAVLRTLQRERGLGFDVVAGHSLGEWSALVAVGAISFADAVRLVRLRGQAMQEAVAAGEGAMAAILGLELEVVEALCRDAARDQVVVPANLNGAGQIVISGHAQAVERAVSAAKARGAKRAVALAVSAPFHCSLMQPAARLLREALEPIEVSTPIAPIVSNVEATPYQDPSRVKQLLVQQVTAPVRWEASVKRLAADGVRRAYELGSGKVLGGLVKRIAGEIHCSTVGEPHEVIEVEID